MTIHVRPATPDDAETVALLLDAYRRFYRQAPDLPLAQAFVRERLAQNDSVILLAQDDRDTVPGFTQLYPSFSSVSACRIWILNDLFVAAEARGRGVGRSLLEAARAHAAATGAKRLDLSTAHDNPAQKLYESLGYQRDTEFFHYSLAVDAQ